MHSEEPASSKAPDSPAAAHERPQQQREADLEDRQPHDDLQDELNRSLGGQNPIARFVGVEVVGDEMEGRIDGDGDSSGKPAADPAWDDDRADHAPSGGDDQECTNRRRQVTADNHVSASHGRTGRRCMGRSGADPKSTECVPSRFWCPSNSWCKINTTRSESHRAALLLTQPHGPGHTHDGFVERDRPGRTEERGITVGEDPAVGGHQPVARGCIYLRAGSDG